MLGPDQRLRDPVKDSAVYPKSNGKEATEVAYVRQLYDRCTQIRKE